MLPCSILPCAMWHLGNIPCHCNLLAMRVFAWGHKLSQAVVCEQPLKNRRQPCVWFLFRKYESTEKGGKCVKLRLKMAPSSRSFKLSYPSPSSCSPKWTGSTVTWSCSCWFACVITRGFYSTDAHHLSPLDSLATSHRTLGNKENTKDQI